MTDQDRIIYEQDKLIAKLKTELDIKTKQLDKLINLWSRPRHGSCMDKKHGKLCGEFNNCRDCVKYYLDYVSKQ